MLPAALGVKSLPVGLWLQRLRLRPSRLPTGRQPAPHPTTAFWRLLPLLARHGGPRGPTDGGLHGHMQGVLRARVAGLGKAAPRAFGARLGRLRPCGAVFHNYFPYQRQWVQREGPAVPPRLRPADLRSPLRACDLLQAQEDVLTTLRNFWNISNQTHAVRTAVGARAGRLTRGGTRSCCLRQPSNLFPSARCC